MMGGAYKRYMRLIDSMLKKDWTVYHISPTGFNNIQNPSLKHFPTYDLPVHPRVIIFFPQAIFILAKLKWKKTKIDAIITFSTLENLIALFYKFIDKDVKVILSIRADSLSGYIIMHDSHVMKKLFYIIFLLIEKISLSNSDLVIFVSNYNKNNLIKRVKPNCTQNCIVIHNDMYFDKISDDESQSIIIPRNINTIGYIGNLFSKGKGIENLIHVFFKIQKIIPDIQLIIVGDGPDKQMLISLVESLNLENHVIFTGYQKNVKKYFNECSLIILPSLHEGISNVLLEAIYLNIPVIGSKVGGTPEVLKYEELMFDPNNLDEIFEKILKILSEPGYDDKIKMLVHDRKQYFDFNWSEKMINAIEKCIKS